MHSRGVAFWAGLIVAVSAHGDVELPVDAFNTDPGWLGVNNVPPEEVRKEIRQDFGWVAPSADGFTAGAVGGSVCRSFTPAWFGKAIPTASLNQRLSASGTFVVKDSQGGSGVLVGWFNSKSRGWRTPNSLVFRLDGEGGKFRVFYEYGTRHWLTGGGETFEGRYQDNPASLHPAGPGAHTWSLDYDPEGADGLGEITFVFDGEVFRAPLLAGHKEDGAEFDRFGLMNVQITGDRIELYVSDLVINGDAIDLQSDPGWNGNNHRTTYADYVQRPHHDVQWRDTARAGGAPGEIGGFVWRIDPRDPDQGLQYGKEALPVSWDKPFEASGRICFASTAVDSAVLIGWYNAGTPLGSPPSNFAGILMEGPSRIGHYFRPVVGAANGSSGICQEGPVIRPDGTSHTWSFAFKPASVEQRARIRVTLDDETVDYEVPDPVLAGGMETNRFGLLSWHQGGHFVEIYVDDIRLAYGEHR
ncbi:MAG: hypothetical protein AMXMBFR84_29500 [Candidatus Hydrogenedentota bacterium]